MTPSERLVKRIVREEAHRVNPAIIKTYFSYMDRDELYGILASAGKRAGISWERVREITGLKPPVGPKNTIPAPDWMKEVA